MSHCLFYFDSKIHMVVPVLRVWASNSRLWVAQIDLIDTWHLDSSKAFGHMIFLIKFETSPSCKILSEIYVRMVRISHKYHTSPKKRYNNQSVRSQVWRGSPESIIRNTSWEDYRKNYIICKGRKCFLFVRVNVNGEFDFLWCQLYNLFRETSWHFCTLQFCAFNCTCAVLKGCHPDWKHGNYGAIQALFVAKRKSIQCYQGW